MDASHPSRPLGRIMTALCAAAVLFAGAINVAGAQTLPPSQSTATANAALRPGHRPGLTEPGAAGRRHRQPTHPEQPGARERRRPSTTAARPLPPLSHLPIIDFVATFTQPAYYGNRQAGSSAPPIRHGPTNQYDPLDLGGTVRIPITRKFNLLFDRITEGTLNQPLECVLQPAAPGGAAGRVCPSDDAATSSCSTTPRTRSTGSSRSTSVTRSAIAFGTTAAAASAPCRTCATTTVSRPARTARSARPSTTSATPAFVHDQAVQELLEQRVRVHGDARPPERRPPRRHGLQRAADRVAPPGGVPADVPERQRQRRLLRREPQRRASTTRRPRASRGSCRSIPGTACRSCSNERWGALNFYENPGIIGNFGTTIGEPYRWNSALTYQLSKRFSPGFTLAMRHSDFHSVPQGTPFVAPNAIHVGSWDLIGTFHVDTNTFFH